MTTETPIEHWRISTALELRDTLNSYTDSELDTMYVRLAPAEIADEMTELALIETTLSDSSTVRDLVIGSRAARRFGTSG